MRRLMYRAEEHTGGPTTCTLRHRYDRDLERFLDASCQGGGTYVDMSKRGRHAATDARIQTAAVQEIQYRKKPSRLVSRSKRKTTQTSNHQSTPKKRSRRATKH